jgi:hypothetical protein
MTTMLIMIIPLPFIPTPRHLLLAILFVLGTLVLISGIISRTMILLGPTDLFYLSLSITESTLSIAFADLPFLTSLVANAAPRISPHLSLSQWPHSRQASWVDNETCTPMRTMTFDSTASTIAEIQSAGELEKGLQYEVRTRELDS